jgi:hypothetical protein
VRQSARRSAGADIGPEAQVVDGLPDPVGERGRDPRLVVDHPRDGLEADPARAATSRIVGRLPSFTPAPPSGTAPRVIVTEP